MGVALKWQGHSFPEGERASDVLKSAVMTDVSARAPARDARVYAIVHEDNHRSLALCRRHGLTEEMSRPPQLPKDRHAPQDTLGNIRHEAINRTQR